MVGRVSLQSDQINDVIIISALTGLVIELLGFVIRLIGKKWFT